MISTTKNYGDTLITLIGAEESANEVSMIHARVENKWNFHVCLHAELFALGQRGEAGEFIGTVQLELPTGSQFIEPLIRTSFISQTVEIEISLADQRISDKFHCLIPKEKVFINLVVRDQQQFVLYAYAVPLAFLHSTSELFQLDRISRSKGITPTLRIYQPNLVCRDAVGNFALALSDLAKNNGLPTKVYAEVTEYENFGKVNKTSELFLDLKDEDIVFVNFSTFDPFFNRISNLPNKKIVYFHNITPGQYFRSYSPEAEIACDKGWKQLEKLRYYDAVFVNSHFTKNCILPFLDRRAIFVVPPVIYSDCGNHQTQDVLCASLKIDKTLLFVGRIVPNKKIEYLLDVLKILKSIEPEWKLTLVGAADLSLYINELHIKIAEYDLIGNVNFLGSVDQNTLEQLFSSHMFFLCLSEHEGFCVPVLEAMLRGLIVVGRKSTAIDELIQDSLDMFQLSRINDVADALLRISNEKNLYQQILTRQSQIGTEFVKNSTGLKLIDTIKSII